jgi:GNAT superfamily N-acetyltransferase
MPTVRLATPGDIPELAAVLARAFARDPFQTWLAGDAPERTQRVRDAWSGILRFGSGRLAATWTTDDLAGVAIWLPPGYRPSITDSVRQVPSLARLVGWRRLRVVGDATEELEEHRRRHSPAPHYYLRAVGVDPRRQDEGIGSALVRPVLDRCDVESVAAYLETAVARQVLLYERLGFDVVDELDLPRTDIHAWLMLRRPR